MAMRREDTQAESGSRLGIDFFRSEPTLQIAHELLGKLLVRQLDGQRLSGIIVETEAYLAQDDEASHSHRGKRRKNCAMFLPAGYLYVYLIHAKSCLNIVTDAEHCGAAVLVRAIQPWEGVETMQALRQRMSHRDIGSGPARLCQAMHINTTNDKLNLCESNEVWLESPPAEVQAIDWSITSTPRIGISKATELPYRMFIDGHLCVSGLARLHSQKRSWLF